MDFNQQLSALNNKIQKLHERTKSKSVSEEVEEIVVMEKKSEQEVTVNGGASFRWSFCPNSVWDSIVYTV